MLRSLIEKSPTMVFDARPEAPLIFKERLLWLLFLGYFFFLVYGTANQLTALNHAVPSMMFGWEQSIPFIPEMIVPYMSIELLFGFSFLLVKTREEIQRHALRLGFVIAFSTLIFLLVPLHYSLEKPIVEGWPNAVFAVLSVDLPYNQLPSLHVSLAMAVGYMYYCHFKGFLRWFFVAWFVLISLSTLFVYQHHFIDLPTGVLAGLFTFYFIPVKGKSHLPLNFISLKHLHIALNYIVVSIIFTLLAFKYSGSVVTLLCSWIAFSMLFVATLYALGHNLITYKKGGQIKVAYWLIFWPYLLANKLLWRIWKKKVPVMVKIADGVWIGRSLEASDEQHIHQNGIKTLIDLAPEICNFSPKGIKQYYQPLLDLAIPNPKVIKEITDKISQAKEQGDVLIQCKFGLSRSMITSCAWLITQGHSKQQAWQIVLKAQPLRVDKPYVQIALELFEAELKEKAVHERHEKTRK